MATTAFQGTRGKQAGPYFPTSTTKRAKFYLMKTQSVQLTLKTLSKAQWTQGIEYFDLFNNCCSSIAEDSTIFEISDKLQHDFVWQGAKNTYKNIDKSM